MIDHPARIQIQNVVKRYRGRTGLSTLALDRVSFDVRDGEFISIVGPSGCGKSTLMMLIAGLIPASGGEIIVSGQPIRGPVAGTGIVFQRDVLLEWRSILANVLLPVEIRKLDPKSHLEKAKSLLEAVGLKDFEDKFPAELSGGMRQRVAICRALVQSPKILLMDEPFGALDALTREQMTNDLQRIWMTQGNTVVFITHSIEEAVMLSDRVIVMSPRPGRIADRLSIDLPRPRGAQSRKLTSFVESVDRIRRHFMDIGVLSEV